MATIPVASTPPPGSPATVNTPPTPRLGSFIDNWEPYTPVRKSARLSARSAPAANRTPSPNQSGRTSASRQARARPPPTSTDHTTRTNPGNTNHPPFVASDMASPPSTTSPKKKHLPASASRLASASLAAESVHNAAVALDQSQKMGSLAMTGSRRAVGLPTPAKTPAQKHVQQDLAVATIACQLFAKQQGPKETRSKQHNNNKPDSLEPAHGSFRIYTDFQDRLPEADVRNDNPFHGEAGIAASAKPVRRSSRKKKNVVGAAVTDSVDNILKRNDGLLYVFRGKKIFRKFSCGNGDRIPAQVKPRLLFPSAKSQDENEVSHQHPDAEEAETDIEEHAKPKLVNEPEVETPNDVFAAKIDTPQAPRFAPASPPATGRTTRSKKTIVDAPTPIKRVGRGGNRSPFDGWRRTKNSAGARSAYSQKRSAESLTASSSKRSKA